MDELIIDEKKYVSSKQAAKITGYAKDYVGQMCREGRVPAQLVGRSWYVLESAIREHRFGDAPETLATEKAAKPEKIDIEVAVASAWETPRYESVVHAPLPAPEKSVEAPKAVPEQRVTVDETWDEWYRLVQTTPEAAQEPTDEVGSIPVRVYHEGVVDREVLPAEEVRPTPRRERRSRRLGRTIYVLSITLAALLAAALAVINSGFIDTYLTSYNRDILPAGLHVFNT